MKKLEKLTLKELGNSCALLEPYEANKLKGGDDFTREQFDDMVNNNTWGGGNVNGMGYVPSLIIYTVDGPNTNLMSFAQFVNSCKNDYQDVINGTAIAALANLNPVTANIYEVAQIATEVAGIAGSNCNLDAITAIAAAGLANDTAVNLSVTKTSNNLSIYDTNGNLIFTTRN